MAVPSIQEAQREYIEGTRAKAGKWEKRTAESAGKWEQNAKSAQAEQNYAAGTQYAAQNQLRLRGLQPVSASEFGAAVSGQAGNYAQRTGQKANKYARNFAPYLDTIRNVQGTIPMEKVPGDGVGNWQRRGAPFVEALENQKRAGGGGVRSSPAAPGGAGGGYAFSRPTYPTY